MKRMAATPRLAVVEASARPQDVRVQLDKLVQQIRTLAPPIAPYFESDFTLREHAQRIREVRSTPVQKRRRHDLLTSVRSSLARPLGTADANLVSAEDLQCVNVVDHHQLLNHQLLVGSNVVAGGEDLLSGPGKPIVVFSCANVGPGNKYMRRGFSFSGRQVPYFSVSEREDAIFYAGLREFDFVERQQRTGSWQERSNSEREFLSWFQALLNGFDYGRCLNHRDQITVAVSNLWPLLFTAEVRSNVPPLLYANAEEVFSDLLSRLIRDDNYLTCSLFDPHLRRRVLEQMDGVFGAWSRKSGKGTHFFWLKHPTQPKLCRLWVNGDRLVPADPRLERLSLDLTRDCICEAMEQERIIPCVALWHSTVLYSGVTPLVGPNSLIYVTALKDRWISILSEIGERSEVELLRSIRTDRLIAGMPIFFARQNGFVRSLAAVDLISTGGVSAAYVRSIFEMPFRDLLSVGAPGIYELFAAHLIPDGTAPPAMPGLDTAAEAVHSWL